MFFQFQWKLPDAECAKPEVLLGNQQHKTIQTQIKSINHVFKIGMLIKSPNVVSNQRYRYTLLNSYFERVIEQSEEK